MQVILLERIEKLGQMGDVVNVKPGYARNYLLPQKKALRATTDNLSYFEREKAQLEAANLDRRADAEQVGEKLAGLFVAIIRNAGDSGQLYGSVNSRDIAEAVSEAGFTVTRGQILMDLPIKALGLHTQRVRLHPEVIVDITVNVAQSDEEAAAQERTGQVIVATESDDDDDDGFAIRGSTFKGAAAAEDNDRAEAPAEAPATSDDDSKEETTS
jgi:large subunit ribosomal protein L9